jgi:hypothetical protein
MRTVTTAILIFAFAALSFAKDESTDELKARVDKARPEDRIHICIEIAKRQLTALDKLYADDKSDQARAALDDVASYSEKARDAAVSIHKHDKNVEIAVRKISDKLRDIKRSVTVDDHPPIDAAIKRLEDVRTSLLNDMFPKGNK